MTTREHLERKLEKRREWANGRQAKAAELHARNEPFRGDWAFATQPGHIPERARVIARTEKAFEHLRVASHHTVAANGIERALDRSIYTDDENATEALEARIRENEAKREQVKLINKLYRKGDAAGLQALGLSLEGLRETLSQPGNLYKVPFAPYELSNLGGRITNDRKRLEFVKAQATRREAAESSANGVTLEECNGGYCRVTFAEKPAREVLDALRAAGFWWGKGSWAGKRESLPASVVAMAESGGSNA